ncbi:hypothetical protein MMC06_005493 [Schaereria dolodes]|nr:hypothetical protein [Schaereria dolodes]
MSCITIPSSKPTSPGVGRSNSTLKKDLLRLVTNPSRPNKTTSVPPTTSTDNVSFLPVRPLSMMGKMKSIHRRRSSRDKTVPTPSSSLKLVNITTVLPESIDSPTLGIEQAADLRSFSVISERSESSEQEIVGVDVSTLGGLPEWCSDASSGHTMIDHDILEKAFGITIEGNNNGGTEGKDQFDAEHLETFISTPPATDPESEDDTKSMEIPIQLVKDRRPKIQVTIPEKRPQRQGPVANSRRDDSTRQCQETPNFVSPPSTTTRQKLESDTATARLSIVSPLSVVEMPKPRRPFSAFSLEGMTAEVPQKGPSFSKSTMSDSSNDTNERDDRLSIYSLRSSISSVSSEAAINRLRAERRPSNPYSVPSPIAAGVFGTPPLKHIKDMRSTSSLKDRLQSPKSVQSVSSLKEKANRNKPLPPEPKFIEIAPLNVSGQSLSRTSSMKTRSRVPPPLSVVGDLSTVPLSRRPSKATSSLRSKYTPKDLDALDDAFQKNGPPRVPNLSYTANSTPTLSQVTLALESHLGTITEDPHINFSMVPLGHDPLQISRGPMRMEPSRKAPPPPPPRRQDSPTQLLLEHFGMEPRKKIEKRTASSNHVATQIRYVDNSKKRTSASILISNTKANRVLGKSGGIEFAPIRMDREVSSDSNWSLSDSAQAYTSSNSPDMSPDEPPTPESDMSVPDAAFEEVRRRLELLSPKDDPSQTFMAFHENNASPSSIQLPILPESIGQSRIATSNEVDDHVAELDATRGPSPIELDAARNAPSVELNALVSSAVAELSATKSILSNDPPASIEPITELVSSPIQKQQSPVELDAHSEKPSPNNLRPSQGSRPHQDTRSVLGRSLASIAMSEIPDIYASLPSPPPMPTYRPSLTAEEVEQLISADAAERVLLRILQSLDNLQDLFAAATVSRGFYRTFKRHELPLIQNALWGMSPAAWELREMNLVDGHQCKGDSFSKKPDGCAALYLQNYMRDMYTMIALKSMILEHCQTFLRADTITALAGGETERSPQIDDAFWRVWSFCRLFGCGMNREDDIVGQMDWLRGGALAKQQSRDVNTLSVVDNVAMNSVLFNPPTGFAQGNGDGLTAEELYDMTEIWNCLGVLVRGFQGKRQEAREFGIFERTNIPDGDVEKEDATLEEWTYHLLTLAPATILDITCPTTPARSTFAHARSLGYTSWTPPSQGASRSTFLKEAVSRVYEEKMSQRRASLSSSRSATPLPTASPLASPSPFALSSDPILASRQRCAIHAAEIRAKKLDPKYRELPVSEERPMSTYPEILFKLDQNPPPMPMLPITVSKTNNLNIPVAANAIKNSPPLSSSSSSSSTTASTALHRPASYQDIKKTYVPPPPTIPIPSGPQVRDPVDVAVEKIVAKGFSEAKAKKALAETDSGNSIDYERALNMLITERKREKLAWLGVGPA